MRNTKALDAAKDDFDPIHNMTLQQLESMAARQQDQIRAQAQLLLAKENRLSVLRKQQGDEGSVRNGQRPPYAMNGEPGRLMALRQKIEQQEMKLRRLRMLRGQVDQTKASNAALTSDLESIRMLFNEKEKELSLAVTRVEELTSQLEDLRSVRRQRHQSSNNQREDPRSAAHAMQLDALRRELMYRQQVTSSQASRVAHQRSLLSQKQEEMNRVDRRIAELQQRLHRRRMFNNQLVSQLSQAKSTRAPAKIAAVEPFRDDLTATAAEERRAVTAELASTMNKNDPKYQTLPYNTKFSPVVREGGNLASHSGSQPMVVHSSSTAAKVTKGQATEVKIAPVPPPKPTSSSNSSAPPSSQSSTSVSNVILSTTRTYTSVYSPDEASHFDVDEHHHHPSQQRPYLPPKPNSIPPRLSPGKVPDSVEEAVSILKAKSEDLIKFEEKSTVEVTTTSGPASLGVSELSVQPAPQGDGENKMSFDVAPPTGVKISINRRIEMPPEAMFPENASPPSDLVPGGQQDPNNNREGNVDADGTNGSAGADAPDDAGMGKPADPFPEEFFIDEEGNLQIREDSKTRGVLKTREKVGNASSKAKLQRRVSFDPLALLLDAALEGEVELVKKCALQAPAAALASNDEGITALHNAVCAGHLEIVQFLVEFGCDVNAQDSDGWTPLHCAASCNNLPMVQYLVEKGACVFATTISDQETAAQKCEEDEDGYDSCSEYLYNVQEKLGIWNGGAVYSLYRYEGAVSDELPFDDGDRLVVVRKGDEEEREWWWSRNDHGREGYVPRNLLGLYPRVKPSAALMKVAGEDGDERGSDQQQQRSN